MLPNPGVEPGAELRQVNGSDQGIGGTPGQGGGRPVRIRARQDHDLRGRPVVHRVIGDQAVTGAEMAQGDENGITGRTKGGIFLLEKLKAGTGERPLQTLGPGSGFPQQENPWAVGLFS